MSVIGIVLFSSYSYNHNISDLGNAFNEVYADRLIAQDYIYKISEKIHHQEVELKEGKNFHSLKTEFAAVNKEILEIIYQYEKTQLTPDEKVVFSDLKKNVYTLKSLSDLKNEKPGINLNAQSEGYANEIGNALINLGALSEIQIARGKDLNKDSIRITSSSEMLNQFTIAMLIFIAVLIQVIVFASKSTQPKFVQDQQLN